MKPEQKADAKTLAGTILEEYYGDTAGAIRYYTEAMRLSPRAYQAQQKQARLEVRLAQEGGSKP